MSDLKTELEQHALMIANRVTNDGGMTQQPDQAHERAVSFRQLSEAACPRCWVVNEVHTNLAIAAHHSDESVKTYTCSECGFSGALPTANGNESNSDA